MRKKSLIFLVIVILIFALSCCLIGCDDPNLGDNNLPNIEQGNGSGNGSGNGGADIDNGGSENDSDIDNGGTEGGDNAASELQQFQNKLKKSKYITFEIIDFESEFCEKAVMSENILAGYEIEDTTTSEEYVDGMYVEILKNEIVVYKNRTYYEGLPWSKEIKNKQEFDKNIERLFGKIPADEYNYAFFQCFTDISLDFENILDGQGSEDHVTSDGWHILINTGIDDYVAYKITENKLEVKCGRDEDGEIYWSYFNTIDISANEIDIPDNVRDTAIEGGIDGGLLTFDYDNALDAYYITGISNKDVRHVYIGDTYKGKPVIGIRDNAFKNCNFEMVKLPTGLKSIGANAFEGCTKLLEISNYDYLADDIVYEISIGANAFKGCNNLSRFYAQGMTSIGDNAFEGCTNIYYMFIDKSCTSIGANAFKGIELHIDFNGSVEEWNSINKDPNWDNEADVSVEYVDDNK